MQNTESSLVRAVRSFVRQRRSVVFTLATAVLPAATDAQDSAQIRRLTNADSVALAAVAAQFASDSLSALAAARDTAEATMRAPIPFAPGSTTLSAVASRLLGRKAWYIVKNPDLRVRLTGFADKQLSGPTAASLARRRATEVRGALTALGVEPIQVTIDQPIDVDSNRFGRVEFAWSGALSAVEIPAPGTRPPPLMVDHKLGGSTQRAVRWGIVRVFYATDRAATGDATPAKFYGADRSNGGALNFGAVDVSIPRAHRVGVVEQPVWYHLEWSADPNAHMIVRAVRPMANAQFLDSLRNTIASSKAKEAFVFIHGFNVAFSEAALRTAQLAYDLGFDGAPIMYSWPSKGSLFGYAADAEEVAWSSGHLRVFLDSVVKVTGAKHVHLIAHSMGNRALSLALQSMKPDRRDTIFNQVVLAAPDIDADLFTQQLAPAMRGTARRISIYASSRDKALIAARVVSTHRRAGSSTGGLVIADGMDTIDASTVDTDLLGHGYFASNRAVIDDLFALLRNNVGPDRRNLRRVADGSQVHWRLP